MANKDPLQSSINKLDNTMNALDKTVKGLTKAFNDMNRTEKSRKVTSTSNDNIGNILKSVLEKHGPRKKDNSLYKDYEKAINKLIENNRDFLTKYDKIREQGYNKDNPSNKIKDVYGIREVQKRVDEILSDLGDLKRGGISNEGAKSVREELYGNIKGVSVDSAYKFINSLDDGSDAILRTAGIFAQARSDVIAFQSAIQNATKTVADNLAGGSKRVSDKLSKMASDSKTLKDVVSNLSHTVTRANNSIDKFASRLDTASKLISANNRKLNGSITSMNTLVKKVQKTSNTINNIQNTLSRKNSSSSSSGDSSFREQATRNSDRAKQAGFIALLIPALARLLRKTPLTDLLRLAALKLGSGASGRGDHKLLGTLGLYAAPIVSGAIATKILTNRALWNYVGKSFLNAPKGITTTNGNVLSYGQLKKYYDNFILGWKQRNMKINQFNRQMQLDKVAKLRVDPKDARKLIRTPDVTLSNGQVIKGGTSIVEGPGANAAGFYGRTAGRQFGRNFERMMNASNNGYLGANALNKAPWLAKTLKWGSRVGGGLAFLGYTADDVTDGKFGQAYKREGLGGFVKQAGKTGVGAAAGTFGALKGAAIGASAGAALGALTGPFAVVLSPVLGLLGGIAGVLIGGKIFKGVADFITGNANKNQKALANKLIAEHQNMPHWFADRWAMIAEPIMGIWETLRALWNKWFGGGNNNGAGGSGANEGALDKQRKQLKKESEEYRRIKDYVDHGYKDPNILGSHKRAYENKMNQFREEYVKKSYSDLFDSSGRSLSWNEYKKVHPDATQAVWTDKWIDYNDSFKKDSDSLKKAQAYADERMKEYLANKGQELSVREAKLNNDKNLVNPQNLYSASQFASWDRATAEKMLASNYEYERIQGRAGIYGVSTDSFINDALYLGRGTQDALADALFGSNIKGAMITSGIGTKNSPHSKKGAHYNPMGNTIDLTVSNYEESLRELKRLQKEGKIYGLIDEYANPSAGATGGHFHFSVTNPLMEKYNAQAAHEINNLRSTATTTTVTTEQQTASSNIREGLDEIVNGVKSDRRQERARNIVLSAVDVTGSLGVWGITQLNNGVMRTGR